MDVDELSYIYVRIKSRITFKLKHMQYLLLLFMIWKFYAEKRRLIDSINNTSDALLDTLP